MYKIIVVDSRIEKQGYADVVDYNMSEKFGLDWKEYSHERMQTFIQIMNLKIERENRERENNK